MLTEVRKSWQRFDGVKVVVNGFHCFLQVGQYSNGRLAVLALTDDAGHTEPYTKLTVNLPDEALSDDQFFVRNCTADEALAQALEALGIIRRTSRTIASEFVSAYADMWEIGSNHVQVQ